MALYFGEHKVRVIIDGVQQCLHLFPTAPSVNIVRLLSSDNYVLKDMNGIYIISKDDITEGD